MINSHYVPMLTLRRFGDKISIYNVKTGKLNENVNIKKAYSEKGFYSNQIEESLNKRIESQFGYLFANKINNASDKIVLSFDEVKVVKKFLLISVIRSMDAEKFMLQEKKYYDNAKDFARRSGIPEDAIKQNPFLNSPFIEKNIENESSFDYWMRTLGVILDSDGSPQGILDQSDKTYPAYRWSMVINNGYLAFWDSNYDKDEFVITDIGMTSENEKGWDGITIHNVKKTNFLSSLLKNEKDKYYQQIIWNCLCMHQDFTENFMMFPISAKRMIVEIDPFFKFRHIFSPRYNMPKLSELTFMDNEQLFLPNDVKYVKPQDGKEPKRNPNDEFIYEIKKLSTKETRYCNVLFLDRINTNLGFSSLNKVVGSLFAYKIATSFPRVDYTELYKIISNRYCSNIDLSNIKILKD